MYDRTLTTYPGSPTPSHTDILLEQIRRDLWATREDLGGVKAGIAMLVKSQEHSFYKTDKAHERITRGEEAHARLEAQVAALMRQPPSPAGPSPAPSPPGFLVSLAALVKAASAAAPPLKELLLALGMALASAALLLQTPNGSLPSPAAPPASATPSAP